MTGELLLDTNAIIAHLKDDVALRELMAAAPRLLLSIVVLGELYYGARKSSRAVENLARIEELIPASTLIYCDQGTAAEYGVIKNEQRLKGHPLPESDIWIASLARQHGLIVVTRDRHFQDVDRLSTNTW